MEKKQRIIEYMKHRYLLIMVKSRGTPSRKNEIVKDRNWVETNNLQKKERQLVKYKNN